MNYQWHYNSLIETRKNRERIKGKYYERHHIIPRSMGGDNSDENLIYLTAREHFIAHWLLWRIHRNRQMACAFSYLCGSHEFKKIKMSSKGYAEAKESMNKMKCTEETKRRMSANYNLTEERRNNISIKNIELHKDKKIGMYGKKHTPEYKALMKEKMKGNSNAKGYKLTDEQRSNLSKSLIGKKKGKPLTDNQIESLKRYQFNKWVEKHGIDEANKRRAFYDRRRELKKQSKS